MTTLAFKATYSDWKLIKTRGVVQVVMEVPLAEADAAYQILGGMPDFSQERWFGVAPLKIHLVEKEMTTPSSKSSPQPTPHPPAAAKREKMHWREVQPATQAALRCDQATFWAFLREVEGYPDVESPETAAVAVRHLCKVSSRAELSANHKARVLWHQLDSAFLAWKHVND
jgi:hypothetical protein